MSIYLGKGWRRKEEGQFFSLQNFLHSTKDDSRRLCFLRFFLDVMKNIKTCHEICIDLCLPISSLLYCYILKLKEMVKTAQWSTELKLSGK